MDKASLKTARQKFLAFATVGTVVDFRCEFWCPEWTPRTVTKRLSAKLAFSHPTKQTDSWLDFPKASEIREESPNTFVVGDSIDDPESSKYWLWYRFKIEGTAIDVGSMTGHRHRRCH